MRAPAGPQPHALFEIPEPMLMDRRRLVQVFQNLLDNAIRHSPPEGTVVVEVGERRDGDRVSLDCVVLDSGPGSGRRTCRGSSIRFSREDGGGTGLGLSIVRRIVKEHGGDDRCEQPA